MKYRKGFALDENFIKLWDKIKHQTRYRVMYETGNLVEKASKAIGNMSEIKEAVIKSTKTAVKFDSGVEYQFAKDCETREDIEFYFKLPFWFKIKTPIGNYNPDWALIKTNDTTVYFVAETKSENQELKISEKRKIKCGKAHFNEFDGVEYRQVVKVSDLD